MAPFNSGNAQSIELCTDLMDLRDELQNLAIKVTGLSQYISNVFNSVQNGDNSTELVAQAKCMVKLRDRMVKGGVSVTHIDAAIGALFDTRTSPPASQNLGGLPDPVPSKRKRTDEDSNFAARGPKKNVKQSSDKRAFFSQEVQKPFSLKVKTITSARKYYTTQASSVSKLEIRLEEDSYKLVIYRGGRSLATSDANCQIYPTLVRSIFFANTGLKIRLEFKDCPFGDPNLDQQMDLEMFTEEDRNTLLQYFSAWGFRNAMAKEDKYMDEIFAAKHCYQKEAFKASANPTRRR